MRDSANGQASSDESAVPLTRIAKGQPVVVISLAHGSSHERGKLMALGILPGATVQLEQRFPSYIVTIGYTQVALDRETAGSILVADGAGASSATE
jgi:ferrous iron transport protein A